MATGNRKGERGSTLKKKKKGGTGLIHQENFCHFSEGNYDKRFGEGGKGELTSSKKGRKKKNKEERRHRVIKGEMLSLYLRKGGLSLHT